MPRPPARRNRAVQRAPVAAPPIETIEKPSEKSDLSDTRETGSTTVENRQRQTRATTPQHSSIHSNNNSTLRSHQLPVRSVKTPTQNSYHDGIVSSPEGRSETTGSRTATRARGYSSTLSSLVGRKGEFSSRIGSTPGFEGSVMSNFRRRPRQPSLLHMMQAENSSDLDDDDFLGGMSPQDESTPLHTARKPSNTTIQVEVVVPPLRKSVLLSSTSSESRKRKWPSPPLDENNDKNPPEPPSSPLSNPPSNLPSSLSSSPMRTPRARPAVDPFRVSATPMSTPGSTQISQEEHVTGSKKAEESLHFSLMKGSVPKIATSTLQSKFLPRRRIRRRPRIADGGYEEDSESLAGDSDDDELRTVVSRRSQDSNSLADITSEYANSRTCRSTRQSDRNHKSDKRPRATSRSASSPQKKKRTYSRLRDKENASEWSSELSSPPASDDGDTASGIVAHNPGQRISSRELELQALKFAEVDKWQMEFEDVSQDWE